VDRDDIDRTSEQVRAILEAAAASAAQIRGQAEDHVARVEQAAGGMLARLDELEQELGGLLESLRRSGERLTEGLARLHEDVATAGGDAPAPRDEAPVAAAPAEPEAPAEPAAPLDGDEAGARLTALNMALGGTPREETARYLAEHYSLADPEALLDDVYDRAGG
jgi:ABC-type transporter Mla subunit MlaD